MKKELKITPAMQRAQENYVKRNKSRDMTRVNVWVPVDCAEELREIAADMRDEQRESQDDGF